MSRISWLAIVALTACQTQRAEPPRGVLTLTASQSQATWIRNFNPLMPGSRWPSAAGIYEPLGIYNSVKGEWVPWLATAWAWRDEGLTLSFTIRDGVKWSDGKPMTAADAAFTGNLIIEYADGPAAMLAPFLANATKLEAPDDTTVVITYAKAVANGINRIYLRRDIIVPDNILHRSICRFPRHNKNRNALVDAIFDEAFLRRQIENIKAVDPWRKNDERCFQHIFRCRVILDELV
jgi:ABC-type transport system substrate-binding protein